MSQTKAYPNYINSQIDRAIWQANKTVDRDLNRGVAFRYDVVFGGPALVVTDAEAHSIVMLDEVKAVLPETLRQIQTDVSPTWLGMTGVWDGFSAL